MLVDFLEKGDIKLLIIYSNSQGMLTPIHSYPGTTKAKVRITRDLYLHCFILKRQKCNKA